jgi:hypothetical protein
MSGSLLTGPPREADEGGKRGKKGICVLTTRIPSNFAEPFKTVDPTFLHG